ncbi:helix-turn-helix domain-containing protein [Limosilactobacillus kribbianus]|uniref:helix-turn-helix domain-containing protein n=1 Tax=Limosilactobacillus kribbianus TaxID=2982695 RepID=UPI002263C356|nr:RodZ domain-containing protein [Limosilactobacillus kribbianus]
MSENNSEQKHLEIGKKLQEARQEKGYTLDDLQQITKIQKRYLIAIEDEKFDELPGDFYIRAFVKQYANTVGLDGDELLKEYDDDLPKAKTAEYSEHITQAVESRTSQHKTLGTQVSKSRRYLPTVIIACVIILVLGAIWFTAIARNHRDSSTKIDNSSVSVSGESRKKASSSSKKTTKKAATKATQLKQSSRNSTSVTYTADKLTKDTTLQINPSSRAWMQVRANNSTDLLNKTLNANQKTSVKVGKDTTTLVITVGNAQSTTLKIGGKKIDFTNNGSYNNTRTVTINFGSQSSSSSSSSSTSSTSSSNTSTRTSSTSSTTSQTSQTTTANSTSRQTTATSSASTTQTR